MPSPLVPLLARRRRIVAFTGAGISTESGIPARLEEVGRLSGVVTQNIDGLHQAAGSARVVELHGTAVEVMCIGAAPRAGVPEGCGLRAPTSWAFSQVDEGVADPRCPACAGLVKSATVSFGQGLFPGDLERAAEWMAEADLVLAIGSSLQVYPAAGLPEMAAMNGADLVILNDEATPLDGLAELVVRGRAGEVLGPAVERVLVGLAGRDSAIEPPSR